MYQFYYADRSAELKIAECKNDIKKHFNIKAVRPAMWEEHCLECAAPLCFESCVHYAQRSDGRCKRFENGIYTFESEKALNGQGARVRFRKWANMMTVLFPAMLDEGKYGKLFLKNQRLGKLLAWVEGSFLPRSLRWQIIRTLEYMRRRSLRSLSGEDNRADAFVFHGYSYCEEPFRLIVEVYDDNTPVFKRAISINKGENLEIIPASALSEECSRAGNLVKIYPENDIEAEMDILWCDFVKGESVNKDEPADKVKCVVWDLDGTLWDGILIETEDTSTLSLRPGIEETVKELDRRGIIQSVSSKNDQAAAMEVLDRLGMSEYFLYPCINWNAKSEAMKSIAESLNIGVDSLCLVDDSPFERRQVKSALSQVRVYDAAEAAMLPEKEEFCVPVTRESINRRAMYRAEEKRNALKNTANTDIAEFIRSCNLRISIFAPETEEDVLRCYELAVRTNQLNMSGVKYTKEEFASVLGREGHCNFAFLCADDFGEYGIVGFGQYRVEDKTLVFTEFAMSCRVAGKFVESALFAGLLEREACEEGRFSLQKTKKNSLLRETLEGIGFVKLSEADNGIEYMFKESLRNSDIVKIH